MRRKLLAELLHFFITNIAILILFIVYFSALSPTYLAIASPADEVITCPFQTSTRCTGQRQCNLAALREN